MFAASFYSFLTHFRFVIPPGGGIRWQMKHSTHIFTHRLRMYTNQWHSKNPKICKTLPKGRVTKQ